MSYGIALNPGLTCRARPTQPLACAQTRSIPSLEWCSRLASFPCGQAGIRQERHRAKGVRPDKPDQMMRNAA